MSESTEFAVNQNKLFIESVESLNGHTHAVRLQADVGFSFQAGQYIELLIGEQAVPYSIASAPEQLPQLELHILDQGKGSLSRTVLDFLRHNEHVNARSPQGCCVLRPAMLDERGPLVLIAAGSGFAQMKSLVESALARGSNRPIHLYWGVRQSDQLYAEQLVGSWQVSHSDFTFVPVVEEEVHWVGRQGLVHQVLLEDMADFSSADVFVCGSPAMVYAVEDDLLPRGLRQGHIHSDVFSYAPRASGSAS